MEQGFVGIPMLLPDNCVEGMVKSRVKEIETTGFEGRDEECGDRVNCVVGCVLRGLDYHEHGAF